MHTFGVALMDSGALLAGVSPLAEEEMLEVAEVLAAR